MKNLTLSLILLSLVGCAADGSFESYHERTERHRVEKIERLGDEARARDSSPNEYAYKDGAAAGCSSGGNATGNWTKSFQKDVKKYINDQYYKSGWDDGFAQCKGQGEQINGVIRDSIR